MKNKHISLLTNYLNYIILTCILMTSAACSWSEPYAKPQAKPTPVPNSQTSNSYPTNNSGSSLPKAPQQSHNNKIVQAALAQLGAPYRYGGNTPNGFDCSGLVEFSHLQAGISVPRTTSDQLKYFKAISRRDLRAGDMAFFKIGHKQYHVAIMISATEFVHAPSSGKSVSTSSFSNPYWNRHFLHAARL